MSAAGGRHTPGPWTLQESGRGGYNVMGGHFYIAETIDGYSEHEANAHLIAQAPDLIAALEGLLAAAPAFRSGTIGAPGSEARARQDAHIAAEDAARAALRRASPADGGKGE